MELLEKAIMAQFLYIVPLKQGLKHCNFSCNHIVKFLFLYIVPLKQGLKHAELVKETVHRGRFLYIVPLKQGLKLNAPSASTLK